MKAYLYAISLLFLLPACDNQESGADASGSFEADEIIVSSELAGKLLSLDVEEGATLAKGARVGSIDIENIELQKQQVEASIEVLGEKTTDAGPQVRMLQGQLSVQEAQLANLLKEQGRIENLYKQEAATGKQLDDINAQVISIRRQMEVTRRQIEVQKTNTRTQNRSILSEEKPLQIKKEQLDLQISDGTIINPIGGTVLTKYAEAGELAAMGKPLYKIADLSQVYLRAYITGNQFSKARLGQQVKVSVDEGEDTKDYEGTITWISGKAEFTPKTIQTKDERANLVYAIKIKVKNDGYLKIGMYGEASFKD